MRNMMAYFMGYADGSAFEPVENEALRVGNMIYYSMGFSDGAKSVVVAVDKVPYNFRASGGGLAIGDREMDKLVGGTVAWNQLVGNETASVTVESGHKYIARVSGAWTCANGNGSGIAVTGGTDVLFDLTQMFGSTIADYVYGLEQATAGAGVAWFRKLFPKDYYAYNAGELMSVNASAHIMRDAAENIIGDYPLDHSLTLSGIPKLDESNALYYDGDTYESDGTVTRRYGVVDLGTLTWTALSTSGVYASNANEIPTHLYYYGEENNVVCTKYTAGVVKLAADLPNGQMTFNIGGNRLLIHDDSYSDAASFKASLSGVYLVYELATPTTEAAEPFQNPQIVEASGTEEYVDYAESQGARDVAIPVGHETKYKMRQ